MENVQGLETKRRNGPLSDSHWPTCYIFFELGPTPIVILDDAEAQLAEYTLVNWATVW
jgi:hypothetical protein